MYVLLIIFGVNLNIKYLEIIYLKFTTMQKNNKIKILRLTPQKM